MGMAASRKGRVLASYARGFKRLRETPATRPSEPCLGANERGLRHPCERYGNASGTNTIFPICRLDSNLAWASPACENV